MGTKLFSFLFFGGGGKPIINCLEPWDRPGSKSNKKGSKIAGSIHRIPDKFNAKNETVLYLQHAAEDQKIQAGRLLTK